MELEVHYCIHKGPPAILIPGQITPIPAPHQTSWRSISILASHQHLIFHVSLFLSILSPTPCRHLFPVSAASFFFIWYPEQYLVRSTFHKAIHYVVFSVPLVPRPSQSQIFSSTHYSQTTSAYVRPSTSATQFHPKYKTTEKIIFLYILIFVFFGTILKTKDSAQKDSKHSLTSFFS